MARETTIPIGVWLPATAAAVIWLVLLTRGEVRPHEPDVAKSEKSEAPPAKPRVGVEQPPVVAAQPTKAIETPPVVVDEPPPKSEPPPSEPPPSVPPPSEPPPSEPPPSEPPPDPTPEPAKEPVKEPVKEPTPEPAKEPVKEPEPAPVPAAEPAPEPPPPPAGWQLLSAAPTDPATAVELRGLTAAALLGDWSAALGAARDSFVTSGDRLAPWLVVAARDSPPAFEVLLEARARVERELLVPLTRRVEDLPWIVVARLDESRRAAWRRRDETTVLLADDASAAQLIAALTRATLAVPGRQVPEWWLAGAAAHQAAGDGHVALGAPPLDARLAPLFETPPAPTARERAAWEALAGSFTAWCLLPDGGGPHASASWFETEQLGDLREKPEELAARFGCAQFAELEARWQAARK